MKDRSMERVMGDEVSFADVAQQIRDVVKPDEVPDLPYIGLEHIEEGKLRLNGFGYSKDIASNKIRFTQNQFLFGKLRPYFRKVVKPNFSGICSTDIWVVNPKNGTNLDFLFYLFANKEFVDLAYKGSSGTRMPRADWKFMRETKWLIPVDINEQKAIAAVLSSLDDKIELLRKQNETLEAIAQAIFKEWFVNFNFPDKNGSSRYRHALTTLLFGSRRRGSTCQSTIPKSFRSLPTTGIFTS